MIRLENGWTGKPTYDSYKVTSGRIYIGVSLETDAYVHQKSMFILLPNKMDQFAFEMNSHSSG